MSSLVECFKKGDYTGYDVTKSPKDIYKEVCQFLIFIPSAIRFKCGTYDAPTHGYRIPFPHGYTWFCDSGYKGACNNIEHFFDFIEQFKPPCYKIASASLTDDGLLRHHRKFGRPIILSRILVF